jgi:hypothetical protein
VVEPGSEVSNCAEPARLAARTRSSRPAPSSSLVPLGTKPKFTEPPSITTSSWIATFGSIAVNVDEEKVPVGIVERVAGDGARPDDVSERRCSPRR